MTEIPAFSVIIPVFNKWELTAACLRSLKEYTQEYAYEVIVVDNASSDATATELAGLGDALFGERFHHMRFDQNRNFSPACNAGAAIASAPLLYFLNNDTLLTPGWAPPLVEALCAETKLAGVGPLLLYENNTVQHLGVALGLQSVEHLYRGFPHTHPVVSKRRFFQAITAAALMMPATLFRKHGGFCEEYRNGFEDVDLCLRIAATGKKFACIPESMVYHLEGQSTGRGKHDDHNAELLKQRCGHIFRVDKHKFAASDDFDVFIDEALSISCTLNAQDAERLSREAEGRSLEDLEGLVMAHPLWLQGKKALTRVYEQNGDLDRAFVFASQALLLDMSFKRYAAVRIMAEKSEDPLKMEFAKAVHDRLQTIACNRALATSHLRAAVERKDTALAGLLKTYIKKQYG